MLVRTLRLVFGINPGKGTTLRAQGECVTGSREAGIEPRDAASLGQPSGLSPSARTLALQGRTG